MSILEETEKATPKKPLWRRLLKWLLIVLLVLILIAVAVGWYLWTKVPKDHLDPLKPGTLSMQAPPESLDAGRFTVELGQDGVQVKQGPLTVWQTAPGVPFVAASRGEVSFEEHFGYFWADVERSATMTDQTVASAQQDGRVVRISGTVSGGGDSADYTLTLRPRKGALQVGLEANGVDSVMLTGGLEDGEQLYGLGEQYRPLDLVGTITPILPREQGLGRGEQPLTYLADVTNKAGGNLETTYAAWPTYLTSGNRTLTFADVPDSGAFTVADLSRDGQISMEAWAPRITAFAHAADSPAGVIAAREAGKTRPPLADWIQKGAVIGMQGGTEKVRKVVAEMQQAGTKISGVWLQDWTGKRTTSFGDRLWWTWQLDRERYPGWRKLVRDLNAQDIAVMTYINPWLVDPAEKGDDSIDNLFEEAKKNGYLVETQSGEPYLMDQNGFDAVLVDFTNPAARDWYADVIAKDVLGVGAVGFMADFGEAFPYDAKIHSGDPKLVHNLYPQLWASVVREGCDRGGVPDCVAFMRSAYLDSSEQIPLMWAGDQMVNYDHRDGMASAVYSMMAGGLSGLPLWHSDIGGYTSINAIVKDYVRPPQLNQRWAQMQAFGVVMRSHEGNRPADNQQIYDTPETRAAFAQASQIYAALYDYRKSVIDEAVESGVPAMRPTWMVFPGVGLGADKQFFLGDHLLVAPVMAENTDTVEVTFPPGTWVNVLTGEQYEGDRTTTVSAPLDTPAAFVLDGDPEGAKIRAALARR